MDFLQLAEERFSVRSFTSKPVEQEKIDAILRAGQTAKPYPAHTNIKQLIDTVSYNEF